MSRGKITFGLRMVKNCWFAQHGDGRDCSGEIVPFNSLHNNTNTPLCKKHQRECLEIRTYMKIEEGPPDTFHGKKYENICELWRKKNPRPSDAEQKRKDIALIERAIKNIEMQAAVANTWSSARNSKLETPSGQPPLIN